MSDWAEKKACKICARYGGWMDDEIAEVAAALRAARNQALEEAAQIAEDEMVCYWIDDLDLTKSNACERVASNIRAFKDKQP